VVTVAGCEYRLEQNVEAGKGVVSGVLTVTNKTGEAVKLDIEVASITRQFTGRTGSRVFSPNDFHEDMLDKTDKAITVKPSAGGSAAFALKIKTATAGAGIISPTPAIVVSVGGKRVMLIPVRQAGGPSAAR
jgi:hypothetical protein